MSAAYVFAYFAQDQQGNRNTCSHNMIILLLELGEGGRGRGQGEWGTGPTADYFARPTKIGLLRAWLFLSIPAPFDSAGMLK